MNAPAIKKLFQPTSSLNTRSFWEIVKLCWWGSGLPPLVLEHATNVINPNRTRAKDDKDIKLVYFKIVEDTLQKIIAFKCLPKNVQVKLANVFLEFDCSIRNFTVSMAKNIIGQSREKIEFCIKKIALTPDGRIDVQKTIIGICMADEMDVRFDDSFMAFYCLGEKTIERHLTNNEKAINIFRQLNTSKITKMDVPCKFPNPDLFWENQYRDSMARESFFTYIAAHASVEALEYFLENLEGEEEDIQEALSNAAMFIMVENAYSCEKFLFFKKHMSERNWMDFLKKNFHDVIKEFIVSKRHRPVCLEILSQTQMIDQGTNLWALQYILDFFMTEVPRFSSQAIAMEDIESIVLYIWKTTPNLSKKKHERNVHKIMKKLLNIERFSLVADMIHHLANDQTHKDKITSALVINLIMNDKLKKNDMFLQKIKPNTSASLKTLISNEHLTYDNIKMFIIDIDNCYNVDDYHKILDFKFSTQHAANIFKQQLLQDREFTNSLLQATKNNLMYEADRFKLLNWLAIV